MELKEIEVLVKPFTHEMNNYVILWRKKKKYFNNWFNDWKRIVTVWDGRNLSYDQPIMFSDFDVAVNYGKKIKANPELITKHYEEQDEIYRKAKERRNVEFNMRNKTIKL